MNKHIFFMVSVIFSIQTIKTGRIENLLSRLQKEAAALYGKAHYFPWGGHLQRCRNAVAFLNNRGGKDVGSIINVIHQCNVAFPEGPQWVQGTFMPWAKKQLCIQHLSDIRTQTNNIEKIKNEKKRTLLNKFIGADITMDLVEQYPDDLLRMIFHLNFN